MDCSIDDYHSVKSFTKMFAYFWQNVMSIGDRRALKSPTVIVLVFICVILDSICFIKLNVPICLIHIFKTIISYWRIVFLISMKWTLFLFGSDVRTAIFLASKFNLLRILFALNLHLSWLKCLSLRYQVWMFINLICILNWWIWIVITQILLKIYIYFLSFCWFCSV